MVTNGLIIGTLLQPSYLMIRMSLAVSLFFVIPKNSEIPKHLIKVLKYAYVGAFITTLLLVFITCDKRYWYYIIVKPILTPNADFLINNILNAGEQGIRGLIINWSFYFVWCLFKCYMAIINFTFNLS